LSNNWHIGTLAHQNIIPFPNNFIRNGRRLLKKHRFGCVPFKQSR